MNLLTKHDIYVRAGDLEQALTAKSSATVSIKLEEKPACSCRSGSSRRLRRLTNRADDDDNAAAAPKTYQMERTYLRPPTKKLRKLTDRAAADACSLPLHTQISTLSLHQLS